MCYFQYVFSIFLFSISSWWNCSYIRREKWVPRLSNTTGPRNVRGGGATRWVSQSVCLEWDLRNPVFFFSVSESLFKTAPCVVVTRLSKSNNEIRYLNFNCPLPRPTLDWETCALQASKPPIPPRKKNRGPMPTKKNTGIVWIDDRGEIRQEREKKNFIGTSALSAGFFSSGGWHREVYLRIFCTLWNCWLIRPKKKV